MEKANVIKALERCKSGNTCNGCPYKDVPHCYNALNKDAIALLKANEPTKVKYTMAYIYTKKGNLIPYITGKVSSRPISSQAEADRILDYYKKEREIQLIALFRWEGSKCFCKIKCPVNPLPVKGEFEVPSTGPLFAFLKANGWSFKQKFYPRMFE